MGPGGQRHAGVWSLLLVAAVCIAVHTAYAQKAGKCYQLQPNLSLDLKPVVVPVAVAFNSSSPQSICYSALFLDCTDPACKNRTTWRWIYGATDKASCEYLTDPMMGGQGGYKNVTCCSEDRCNAPKPIVDKQTVIQDPERSQGRTVG